MGKVIMQAPRSYRHALRRPVLVILLQLVAGLHLGAQTGSTLERVVEWRNTITLEENDRVINVRYNVTLDPAGGYLVADEREGQFRRYTDGGRLVWAFGRVGDGPAEFRSPSTLVRLPSRPSHVALLDRQGKVVIYDEQGDSLVSTARAQLSRVQDVIANPDGTLWVAAAVGLRSPDQNSYLHLIDPLSGRELGEMFDPPISDEYRRETLYMNWAGIGVLPGRDTVWSVTATRDTIYALHPGTRRIVRRIPLSSRLVRPLTRISADEWNDVAARRKWAERQSYLTDVYPLRDGRLIVQFEEFRNGLPVWGLLIARPDGVAEFETLDTHRLLTVDPDAGVVVFQDINATEGNRWLVGKLR